jgi:solute carrier family 25 aspartate/glutamate transporter 12/13
MVVRWSRSGCRWYVIANSRSSVRSQADIQAGELARAEPSARPMGVLSIVRSLGLVGLYKGCTACLARDIPFVSSKRNG